ncbi:hypothetical protein PAXINDRAFT_14949 [Paxillus involutus ATCC 200175]|uniref:Uncharacterized protein n=1 Tax=Paxillus involutus ATCC 200175 TaxID=664439 RepID=A0A0C9TY54_PAXIN|nr:hypothetical protein PAXINDRAFT_14949 [Paxillus involutus ATCC 200175]
MFGALRFPPPHHHPPTPSSTARGIVESRIGEMTYFACGSVFYYLLQTLARRVLILIAVHNLPLQLPDPLAALGPLLLDSNVDSEEAARAILRVGTVGPPKQEGDASESSIPWTDTWWLPGGEALASDCGTRSLQAFAQLARERFDAGSTKLETLRSRNLPLLCLELMQMELAVAYQPTRQALCKVEVEISFNFKRKPAQCPGSAPVNSQPMFAIQFCMVSQFAVSQYAYLVLRTLNASSAFN